MSFLPCSDELGYRYTEWWNIPRGHTHLEIPWHTEIWLKKKRITRIREGRGETLGMTAPRGRSCSVGRTCLKEMRPRCRSPPKRYLIYNLLHSLTCIMTPYYTFKFYFVNYHATDFNTAVLTFQIPNRMFFSVASVVSGKPDNSDGLYNV